MGSMKFFEQMIDQELKDLHTAYIGKVVSVADNTATVQPLGLIKGYGGSAKKRAVVSNVPITKNVLASHAISKDDLVVCLCCDRDITEALKGNDVVPPAGHHSLSDSIIVGVL